MLKKENWEVREKELSELEEKRKELKRQLKEKEVLTKMEFHNRIVFVKETDTELREQIKEISKKIHKLQNARNQHEKHKEQKVRTDTATYQMFGKPLKELTKEEFAFYQSRGERRKRKENKTCC